MGENFSSSARAKLKNSELAPAPADKGARAVAMRNDLIILYAPRIHTGGGLVLLRELLASPNASFALIVDPRVNFVRSSRIVKVETVRAGLSSYIRGEIALHRMARAFPEAHVLCLNSLSPLFRVKNRTSVFIQNRFVVDRVLGLKQSLKLVLRHGVERLLWRLTQHNADEFLVQSASMAKQVLKISPHSKVRLLPFLDSAGFGLHGKDEGSSDQVQKPSKDLDFVYPASPDPHKNHECLLLAWEVLADQGFFPTLGLTLSRDHKIWSKAEELNRGKATKIVRLEENNSALRDSFYDRAKALIFPSLLETYGLPLLEAANRGLPILAGELDFIRDSVVPSETFDPRSPISIARAVRRWMGQPERTLAPLRASEFLTELRELPGGRS